MCKFYKTMPNFNKFDNICLDLPALFEKQNFDFSVNQRFSPNSSTKSEYKIKVFSWAFSSLRLFCFGFLYKTNILPRLMYANVLLGWFNDFKRFWVGFLGNRVIDIFDFHFLRQTYRAKFQEVSLDHGDEKNPSKFLAAWQEPGTMFYLLQSVWRYSKSAFLEIYPFYRFIKPKSHILEYGCGIAPATQGLIRYCSYKNLKFTLADISQIAFLCVRWKLSQKPYVNFITINPSIALNLPKDEQYDTIICLTVLEHLTNPTEVVENFIGKLKPGVC